MKYNLDRNVSINNDNNGNKIVVIHNIKFNGKRSIKWNEVEDYLKDFVGCFYKIECTKDIIYIGTEFPDEYTGSKYTYSLRGTNAKAKANAVQGIPEMLKIARGKYFRENKSGKHKQDAAYGWYRYDSRFALPVYREDGKVGRYNIFHASIIIRHANNGKMYLYDIMDIKKETGNLFTY